MRIAIIGGGLTGLVAGYSLSENHEVVIFEQDHIPGGLLSSYEVGHFTIERYYHHFFSGDASLMDLLDDLHLQESVIWLSGSTGSYKDGKIHPLTSPFEILQYPYLRFTDKIKLALFTRRSSHMDHGELDEITARDFILSELGERIYSSFFEPLLRSKFGENAGNVSAAWLISRVAIRSDRGVAGERLGYLKGGFSVLISALVSQASARGCRILLNSPVRSVVQVQDASGGWELNGEHFDILIGTCSPKILSHLGVPGISDVPYQGAACMTLALTRDIAEGIYWVNMIDSSPYGAVVSHTNFAPFDWYGEYIVYLASYFTGDPDPDIREKMLSDFCTKFSVDPHEILWTRLAIDNEAGPLYLTGYKQHLIDPTVSGLYLAGMFSPENYPERSIEGSIKAARRVVEGINNL